MAVSAVSTCPDYIFILQQRIDVVSAPAAATPTFLFSPARNYHKRQASFLYEGLLQPPTQARLTCVARSSSCISGGCDLLEFRKVSICLSLESERTWKFKKCTIQEEKAFVAQLTCGMLESTLFAILHLCPMSVGVCG